MSDTSARASRLPPRWFIRLFWAGHRAVYRVTGGRFGLWRTRPGHWGTMRITTTGRRTGRERRAIIAYLEDGPNLSALAMNGWADPEPAWWLNLRAHPDTTVVLPDGPRRVHAHAATGAERDRLWARWAEVDEGLDGYAARRSHPTAVVVLEPVDDGAAPGAPVGGPPPKPSRPVTVPAVLALTGGPVGFIVGGLLWESGAPTAAVFVALSGGPLVGFFCGVSVLATAARRPVRPAVEAEPPIRIAGLPPGIGVRGDTDLSVSLALVGLFILALPVLFVFLIYLTDLIGRVA